MGGNNKTIGNRRMKHERRKKRREKDRGNRERIERFFFFLRGKLRTKTEKKIQ